MMLGACQVAGMEVERLLQKQRSMIAVDEVSQGSALRAALCNHPPGAELTPFMCRPVGQVFPPQPTLA